MRIYKTRLAKTKYHTYIIRSNIEGADIIFDNQVVGQISNGVYYHKIKEQEDTGTHTVQLQNGTLPVEDVIYKFGPRENFIIDANGGDITFDDTNFISEKVITTYSPNNTIETLTIENNSCTINANSSETTSNVRFSPTNYYVPVNETKDYKTYPITFIQNESNKRISVGIRQRPGVEYTYIIISDIEGARVLANNEPVGFINDGRCQFTKWNNKAGSLRIVLVEGTLVTKEDGYTFEVATPTKNVSADGGTFDVSTIVTSLVGSYTPKYPAAKYCDPNDSIVLNTEYDYNTVDAAYTVDGQVTFAENETADAISREITITQTDTNQSKIVTITQEAGVRHTYTILSDCEGATVNIGGSAVGTISNGQFVYGVWNSKAPASINVSLTGGLPTAPSPDYSFSVSQSSLSFTEDGGTKNLTITSNKTSYSYSNTSGTCQRDSSVTCNAKLNEVISNPSYSASESLSWITTNRNQVIASANSNYSSRSGSITYTQAESGKTDTVTVSQEAKTEYTYTVNSNCNGGTVYFNNVRKGTISGGRLVFTDEAASGTVRISGGVPSNSRVQTDTDYDYDTDTESDTDTQTIYNISIQSSISMPASASSKYVDCVCNTGTRSRSMSRSRDMTRTRAVYTNYNYSAPSNKTCQGNGSVTMNYTSSTSTSYGSWGSWSYGSWGSWNYGSWSSYSYSRRSPNVPHGAGGGVKPAGIAVYPTSTTCGSGSTMGYRLEIRCEENTDEEARSGYQNVVHPDNSSYTDRITINQAAADVEYVFATAGTLNPLSASRTSGSSSDAERGGTSFGIKCYKRVGNTITQLGITMDSHSQINDWWATNGSTYGENKGTNTGWQVNFSANQSRYVANTNNPYKTHSYTVTMRQKESNKTLSVTVKQYDYYIAFTTSGVGTLNWNFPYTAGNGGNNCWVGSQNGYGSVDWVAGTGANSFGTYNPVRGTNGTQFQFNATANNSFSLRKGSIPFSIDDGNTIQGAVINITQQAAPNVFYINGTKLTAGNYAISRGSVTSLNTTGTVPLIAVVGASKLEINAVLTANNNNTVAAPFTAYTSQSFKLWRRAGSSGSWTLVKTFSVSPGNTVTA